MTRLLFVIVLSLFSIQFVVASSDSQVDKRYAANADEKAADYLKRAARMLQK